MTNAQLCFLIGMIWLIIPQPESDKRFALIMFLVFIVSSCFLALMDL